MNRLANIIAQTLSARETICLNQCFTKTGISDPECLTVLENLRLVSQLRDIAASHTGFHNLTPLGVEVIAYLRRAPTSNVIQMTRNNAIG
jgi:hypothetical protein